MRVSQGKTIRFSELVKKAGQPEQVTLWTPPKSDPAFMRAANAGRVVTVVQHNVGNKKDYGIVGFLERSKAAYLVFPKRIDEPHGTKVIGIKYEAVAPSKPVGGVYKPKRQLKPGMPMRGGRKPAPDKEPSPSDARATAKEATVPKLFLFESTVELAAKQRIKLGVEARSRSEATRTLKKKADELEIDLDKAEISRKLSKPAPRKAKSN